MRTEYFSIIVLGTLACMLVMDGLVFQPLMNDHSNLVYAMGRRPHNTPYPSVPSNPGPPSPVPEPSTLILLGSGVASIGTYLYYKHRNNKK